MKNSKRWISILLVISILLNMHSVSLSTMAAENGETAQAAVSGETGSVSNEEIAEESEENASETGSEENISEGDEEDSSVGNATSDGDENIDIEDDADDQTVTEETDGTASELVQRKLTARAVRVSAWEKEEEQEEQEKKEEEEQGQEEEVKFFTDQMYWAENLWQWMFERQAKPEAEEEIELLDDPDLLKAVTLADGTTLLDQYVLLEDSTPLEVEISGRLPEDVEAVARYVDFDRSEDARSESALFAVDVTFYNTKTGEIYVPEKMEMLTVTLKGETVSTVVRDEKPLLAYANAPEERTKEVLEELESGYVSTVRVFTSGENVDPERLAYVAGMDGDRFYFQEDGEQVLTWDKTEEEPEKISFKTYALNTQMKPLRFVISAQQTEHTVTAESGDTEVSVTGAISEKVELDVADAVTAADSTGDEADSDNATESGNAVESDSAADGESNAETVTETVVDVEVRMSYEGIESYVPDTTLTYTVENAAIGEAVENGGEVTVSVTDENAELVQVEDAVVSGDTVVFEADAVPGRIMVTVTTNGEVIAPGQTTVTSTTAKNEEAEGDNQNDADGTETEDKHNPKVSIEAGEYNETDNTITYTVTVEAEGDMDYTVTTEQEGETVSEAKVYPVVISDMTAVENSGLAFGSGTYSYAYKNGSLLEGDTPSQVGDEYVEANTVIEFTQFPLTVAHMHDGDKITLTYTATVTGGTCADGKLTVSNTASITNKDSDEVDNPANTADDDSATYESTLSYNPLTREMTDLEGSWATWKVTVNSKGYIINGGSVLTLEDTFDDEIESDARQSIDYANIKVNPSDNVTYDYSGKTGTFKIPDRTSVTITYRTRIAIQTAGEKSFTGTAELKDSDGNIIATDTENQTRYIYPSSSDAAGTSSNYMIKLFAYGDANMQTGVKGAKFILMDANKRPMEYKLGDNQGNPVTFRTAENGFVNIELHEEEGDVSIEKNTIYYLEMIQAPDGYQKDNTLYSFMITNNPGYDSEDVYTYYNGDTMKVRMYTASPGLRATFRFSGNYELTQEQQNDVTAVLESYDSELKEWKEEERNPNSDVQDGAISFDTELVVGIRYRVRQENEKPWDVPETINLTSTYYCIIGSGEDSDQTHEPKEFTLTTEQEGANVTVVIDNRYEEPKLTITKMDKENGKELPGAEFTVKKVDGNADETDDEVIKTYTTGTDGLVEVSGGDDFESETLYYIVETKAPALPATDTEEAVEYLMPLNPQKVYFYFCNDEALIPEILENLPAGETAYNLTETYKSLTIDNQKKYITIPVMQTWQNNDWPENVAYVEIGLYQKIGDNEPEQVMDENNTPRTVRLYPNMPYNNTAFTGLPARDDSTGSTITYSIQVEGIYTAAGRDIRSSYVQEYGISDSGVYVVRSKEATSLTVYKEWYSTAGYSDTNKVTDPTLLEKQFPVTFDVYRTTDTISEEVRAGGVTNDEMAEFVKSLDKVRSGLTIEVTAEADQWKITIDDLDKYSDDGSNYNYYVLETVPSFGDEIYVPVEATEESDYGLHQVTIKNTVAPEQVSLTVTKAPLVGDDREASLDKEFEFILELKKGTHPIRSYTVFDEDDKKLSTDEYGKVTFKLKPAKQDGEENGNTIELALPVGVTATITESPTREYAGEATSETIDLEEDDDSVFKYVTKADSPVTVTFTNTLQVVCKVVSPDGVEHAYESLNSALEYIRANSTSFSSGATIEMLTDYYKPETDIFDVGTSEKITLTTAPTEQTEDIKLIFVTDRTEDTDKAIIYRAESGESMLINEGILTLSKIILDGEKSKNYKSESYGGLVNNSGTLTLTENTFLRNSASVDKGGAIYSTGTVEMPAGSITGNEAASGSAIYLHEGELNMTGGRIENNIVKNSSTTLDGAVSASSVDCTVNLSQSPVIYGNRNNFGRQANLYLGVNSDYVINVVNPGLSSDAKIGITAIDSHNDIGEQFANAVFEMTDNLNCFINDQYEYRGKLKDGTLTNIVWDGMTLTIQKIVPQIGANANDRFTITLTSSSIRRNSYTISTINHTVTPTKGNVAGKIVLTEVKANDVITISPLPVSDYTITEEASNYAPTYSGTNIETSQPINIENGVFSLEGNSTVTVTNTRRLANVNLKKTLTDKLLETEREVDFQFTVLLTEADGTTPITNFPLKNDGTETEYVTGDNGTVTFLMSPKNKDTEGDVEEFQAPVGAIMTITEDVSSDYRVTTSAETMPSEGEGASITDTNEADNILRFDVTDDGADVTFSNVRKMAEIELKKELVGKVSKEESFDFSLTLQHQDGNPAANYAMYEDPDDEEKNIVTDAEGKVIIPFTLGENESSKSITLDIPAGTKFSVVEVIEDSKQDIYNTTLSVNGGEAETDTSHTFSSVVEGDKSIVFTNTRNTQQITVTNTVSGYSGNTNAFAFTATVTDGENTEKDYDANEFTDGVQTFELATGQNKVLTVPYGANLTIAENFVVGYDTTIQHGNNETFTGTSYVFNVSEDVTVAFSNAQLIGLQIVNNTSSALENINIKVGYGTKIYRVNDNRDGQVKINIDANKEATISIEQGKTAILEIEHETSVTATQDYTVTGNAPVDGYYYTIKNESSYHEYADPAVLRVYNADDYTVKGKLRYSVSDSVITFTEQPMVSFDVNGGVWTTEMEGYHDKDGNREVYQMVVDKGERVTRPTDPVYPSGGIDFLGWTTDQEFAKQDHTAGEDISSHSYNFDTPVVTPVELYAVWSKSSGTHIVTVKNAVNKNLSIAVTLTKNSNPLPYVLYSDTEDPNNTITTSAEGEASFELTPGAYKNLSVPDTDVCLKLEASDTACTAYSTVFTDADSIDNTFTINPVDKDGTVAFIGGICKITDEGGNILYKQDGTPAVYSTLETAFSDYEGDLYTDANHMNVATQAAVKMLVEEHDVDYISQNNKPQPLDFPKNKRIILTTAGKEDEDFPYVGTRSVATLVRPSANYDCMFRLGQDKNCNVTLTNIILDGNNVPLKGSLAAGMVYVKTGELTVDSGTTFRNTSYSDNKSGKGGAIGINGGTVNIHGGIFKDLNIIQGGAINVNGSGVLNIDGSKETVRFERCTATNGGAIYVEKGDLNIFSNENDDRIVFENCIAKAGRGGAIYYKENNSSILFENNEGSTINGGDNRSIVFKSCKAFSNNNGEGGAIYVNGQTIKVEIKGCKFTECSAKFGDGSRTNGGGGIAGQFINGMTISNCIFTDCDTMRSGGAILARIVNGKDLKLEKCDFIRCNCRAQGGAVGVYQENEFVESDSKIETKSCKFQNCSSGTENGSGGAIQCYIGSMEYNDTEFTDCWAGKEGGAINHFYANADGGGHDVDMWEKSHVTVNKCKFIRCRAEDRYDITGKVHFGGGIATKTMHLTVENSTFEKCVSTLKQGGAIHCSGINEGSTATITGSTFKNCVAKDNGGAVCVSNETLSVSNSNFYGCSSFAQSGGAIYHGNSINSMTQKNTIISQCTFSENPEETNEENKESCSAAWYGGAVWTKATTGSISDCNIKNCTAYTGGGFYINEGSSVTFTDCDITGNRADWASAVFVNKNGSAKFKGTENPEETTEESTRKGIIGNITTNAEGCALEVSNDGTGKLYFEGSIVVKDNICSEDLECDHDVRLHVNNNTTINTTNEGLFANAKIGVYVSNGQLNNHGKETKPFGTWAKNNDYLDCFFNDRYEYLTGYESSDNQICWGYYVCKITDSEGKTLVRPGGRDAVYQKLTAALEEFTSVTGGTATYIKMLVGNYELQQTEQIINFPSRKVVLTTELNKDESLISDGKYPYRGDSGTVCTISRTNSTKQLFKLDNSNATFALENITLDGRKNKSSETGDYRLIEANQGEVIISKGTTLQYGSSSHGGAIFAGSSTASVTIEGNYDSDTKKATVKFINCTASGDNNGGAVYANKLTINNNSNVIGECGTIFTGCTAARGGAICVTGDTMTINGVYCENCHCNYEGGAFYHNNTGNYTTKIDNCVFSSCFTGDPGVNGNKGNDWSYGGAITSKVQTLIVQNSSFEDCYALSSGGAINHGARENGDRTNTTIKSCSISNCRTTGTYGAEGYGGAICTRGKIVELTDCNIENCTSNHHGGALYCYSSDGNGNSGVTISGTTIENCSVSRDDGRGGAISSRSKKIILKDSDSGKVTKITGCTAKGYSGAVHMDTDDNGNNQNLNLIVSNNTEISKCYANMGGAIYLKNKVTMELTGSPTFSQNGYTTIDGAIYNAEKGACIYLAEGSELKLSGSPKFSRNVITDQGINHQGRVTNGGETDYMRQDIYLAGYENNDATSIYLTGELTGDVIWVWPERKLHKYANNQFAQMDTKQNISDASLNLFRNALDDTTTSCANGEYLAGLRLSDGKEKNVYWGKVYTVSLNKIDNKGVPVAGAEFTLYTDAECTTVKQAVKSADGITDTAQGEVLPKGKIYFTSIPIGIYYMKETEVPDSFKPNDTKYIVLTGTPSLTGADNPIWENGALSAEGAREAVIKYTTAKGIFYGIFPLDSSGKADFSYGNLAASNAGITNVRDDYEAYFMKTGSAGDVLPGAKFTIYTEMVEEDERTPDYEIDSLRLALWSRDGVTYPEPATSADGSASFKDKNGDTLPKGVVYFKEIPIGTYYLMETTYPDRNGSRRRTFYVENDRVFKLEVKGKNKFELSERNENGEYDPVEQSNYGSIQYYVIRNEEAVCKLTDEDDNLLYHSGNDGKTLLPAIYSTLDDGFTAAGTGVLLDREGKIVANDNTNPDLKLKVLKDFDLSHLVTWESVRGLTVTTAERNASSTDKYVFTTTRTSNTSRAVITKSNEITYHDSLITVKNDARLAMQNIEFDGNNIEGRAVYVESGSFQIGRDTLIEKFDSSNMTNNYGGAVYMENGTTLTIDGGNYRTAEFVSNKAGNGGAIAWGDNCTINISNAQFTGNNAQRGNGGAVIISSTANENLSLANVVFTSNTATNAGGALYINENCGVQLTDSIFSSNNATTGGAVYAGTGATVTLSDSSIRSNTATTGGGIYEAQGANVTLSGGSVQSNTATNGGAIYVDADVTAATGATLTLQNDPTISNNTANTAGAGIYLKTGSTLNLSGEPNFGGSGITAGNLLNTSLTNKYNGGANYTNARQDIYIEEAYEYTNEKPASIQITDDLTGDDGTIWVWAESENHNNQFMPFAKPVNGVVFADVPVTGQLDAAHLKVFRNAQDDVTTGNATETYLFGTIRDDTPGYVYWGGGEGVAHVMLVKVQEVKVQQSGTEQTGTTYQALQGKKFSVYRDTDKEKLAKGKVYRSETGEPEDMELVDLELENLTSGAGGAFFIGEMPYGTYYVFENDAEGYFPITVDKGGVIEITDPNTDPVTTAPVKKVELVEATQTTP